MTRKSFTFIGESQARHVHFGRADAGDKQRNHNFVEDERRTLSSVWSDCRSPELQSRFTESALNASAAQFPQQAERERERERQKEREGRKWEEKEREEEKEGEREGVCWTLAHPFTQSAVLPWGVQISPMMKMKTLCHLGSSICVLNSPNQLLASRYNRICILNVHGFILSSVPFYDVERTSAPNSNLFFSECENEPNDNQSETSGAADTGVYFTEHLAILPPSPPAGQNATSFQKCSIPQGQVLDSRSQSPWNLSFLTDMFWGAVEFISLFFRTILHPDLSRKGNVASSRFSDGRGSSWWQKANGSNNSRSGSQPSTDGWRRMRKDLGWVSPDECSSFSEHSDTEALPLSLVNPHLLRGVQARKHCSALP
ncbi:hypothetical protein CCH79_00010560 [Gambusia affinis]|uniref:Selenoprotein K n=1 Tax=Gambusia affinis TaxID=33528 RepID=A0A315W4Q6_GAMAF|nr:hypothetical protein CCH79_00010560 [Gambusia affinis]